MSTIVNGWIDVTESPYNADPTGLTDCVGDINMAIGALGTTLPGSTMPLQVLYFPPGSYLLASGGTLNNIPQNTTVLGCGVGTTTIKSKSSSRVLNLAPQGSGVTIRGLSIEYDDAITTDSNAIVLNENHGVNLEEIAISGAYCGVSILGDDATQTGSAGVFCDKITVDMAANSYAGFSITQGYSPGNSAVANSEIHFIDCVVRGSAGALAPNGWLLQQVSGVFMAACFAQYVETGLNLFPNRNISPTLYDSVFNCEFTDCSFDSCTTGIAIQAPNNVNLIYDTRFTGCRITNCISGVLISAVSGALRDLNFSSCVLQGNQQYGMYLENVYGCIVTGSTIIGDATVAGSFAGIYAVGMQDLTIVGCQITGGSPTATTYYGVSVDSSSSLALIEACNLSGNKSGPITGVTEAASNSIWANLGFNPSGYQSIALPPSSPAIVANQWGQNATIYLTGITTASLAQYDTVTLTHGPFSDIPGTPYAVRIGPRQYVKLQWTSGSPSVSWFFE